MKFVPPIGRTGGAAVLQIRDPGTYERECVTRRLVWQRGIKPMIAKRQADHGSGLGRHRWVVERTFAWLHNRRRLLIRTDRRHQTH